MTRRPPRSTRTAPRFPYTTLFRSRRLPAQALRAARAGAAHQRHSPPRAATGAGDAAGQDRLRRILLRSGARGADARRRLRPTDHRRGFAAKGVGAAGRRADQPRRPGRGKRGQRQRPHHRRAGHPPAPQDRGRPEVPALSADCARHRLRADAGLTLRATAADDPPAPDKGALSAAPADPLYPHGAPGRVRRLLPRSLLGRSVLIIVTPLILLQVISTWVFYDRHYDTITKRLAQGLAGDVAAVIALLEPADRKSTRLNYSH